MVRRKNRTVCKVVKSGYFLIFILLIALLLSNVGSAANETILVATNRYVILDEPRTPLGLGTGFIDPETNYGTNNFWDGVSTTINATSMYLRSNGTPISSKQINFTIYWPNGTQYAARQVTTDSNGLASAGWDLNNKPYYGNWTIKAEADGTAKNTTFIYNWWGCASWSGTSECGKAHTNKDPSAKGTATRNSPYSRGPWDKLTTERSSKSSNKCTICHTLYDGKLISSRAAGLLTENPSDVHRNVVNGCQNSSCHGNYVQHGTNQLVGSCYSANCHKSRTGDVSSKNTLDGSSVSRYSSSTGTYDRFHTPSSTVPCILCHGPMHNITKPDKSLRFVKNNDTESSQCIVCHTNYNKHKGSMNCTLCHSDDVHAIKVFSQSAGYVNLGSANQGNCTSCHQNATFLNILIAQPRAGRYSGPPAPQINKPMNHSDDSLAGTKWGSHWTSQQTACIYCHDNTLHDLTPLGRILKFASGYQMYGTIGTNTSCANCHYKDDSNYGQMTSAFTGAGLLIPPEITNGTSWKGNFTDYYNHSFATYQDKDCKPCHGSLLSTGANMGEFQHNAGKGTAGGADCKACHDLRGSAGPDRLVNFSAMNSSDAIHKNLNSGAVTSLSAENKKCWACHGNGSDPGKKHHSNYKEPYKCVDCHVPGASQNLNFTPKTILNVSQHYWNGTNISTRVTSCNSCHNRTEMLVGINLDPDGGEASNNSGHYGKKRTDMAGWDKTRYCSYCHNTTTNNLTFYVSNFNNTIFNHTSRATTPSCNNSTCHNTGRIHDKALTKPVSNDTFCKKCHGQGGSAVTNNKAEHKNLYCTECHANSSTGSLAGKDVHAIKFLTRSNAFSTTNTNAVNCVTCHQTSIVDTSMGSFSAFKIEAPMHHSDNASNGSIWGSYWTTPEGACIYCHSDTRHNATPLGRILQFAPGYQMYSAIGTNTSCSNCHYKGDSNYPQMITTFTTALLNIPPEITNGTNWTGRSGNYYNHSLDTYQDRGCKPCHGSLLSGGANMSEFQHNVAQGTAGSADCIACHDIGGSVTGKLVNFSAMNNSDAIHKNLNSLATTAMSPENNKCWACHGNGSDPGNKHPSNYKNPYDCEDCHVTGAGQNLNFTPKTILNVSQHYWNGTNITTNVTSCDSCHNKTEMLVGINLDPDGPIASNNSGHYGKKRDDIYSTNETNCSYCHNGTSEFNDVFQKSSNTKIKHDNGRSCYLCHRSAGSLDGRIHDSSLIGGSGGEDCISCHAPGDVNTSKFARHASLNASDGPGNVTNSDCWTCHYQKDMDRSHVYLCDSCHKNSSGVVKVNDSALIVSTLKHASNTCKSCHAPDTYHVQGTVGPSGRVENPGWRLISAIDNTGCHDCHRTHNGLDEPFHGPGIGAPGPRHIATNSKNNGSDCSSTCHTSNTNPHDVKSGTNTLKPTLSTPALSPSTGNSVEVITTGSSVSTSASLHIEAAQYRIYNSTGKMIVDWTAMNAKDGRFNSSLETVNATINTMGFPEGTYTVSVRVMASGPRTNTAIRYYPLNGDWSTPLNATLVVKQQRFINGTVKNTTGAEIPGATITTDTGVSAVTNNTGFYSLSLTNGTYILTATKEPEYYINNTIPSVTLESVMTVTRDIILTKKPTGTISGVVMN